jgi:hypothetical protein
MEAVRDERRSSQVTAWRREQLVAGGFPFPLAVALSRDTRYDLHDLLRLVERGCPPRLAARILAPVCEGSAA